MHIDRAYVTLGSMGDQLIDPLKSPGPSPHPIVWKGLRWSLIWVPIMPKDDSFYFQPGNEFDAFIILFYLLFMFNKEEKK